MRPVNAMLARARLQDVPRRRGLRLRSGTRALFALAPLALAGLVLPPEGPSLAERAWRVAERALMAEPALPVRTIAVRGAVRTDLGELRRLLAPFYGKDILEVDIGQAERLLHSLPWVADAEVRRLLPDRLEVEIEERTPTALWRGPDGLHLLDEGGRPIPVADPTAFAHLPRLAGAGAPAAWPALVAVLADFPTVAERLVGAVRVGERRWNLQLRDGIEVRLPERDVRAALGRLAAAQRRHRLLERAVRAVDLRHGGWIAVQPDLPVEAAAGRVRS